MTCMRQIERPRKVNDYREELINLLRGDNYHHTMPQSYGGLRSSSRYNATDLKQDFSGVVDQTLDFKILPEGAMDDGVLGWTIVADKIVRLRPLWYNPATGEGPRTEVAQHETQHNISPHASEGDIRAMTSYKLDGYKKYYHK